MAKTTQVMKLAACGKRFTVTFHHGTNDNPFWLYEHHYGYNKYGQYREQKKLIVKYQNMSSILYYLVNTVPEFYKDCWEV